MGWTVGPNLPTAVVEPRLLVRAALKSLMAGNLYPVVCDVGSAAEISTAAVSEQPKLVVLGRNPPPMPSLIRILNGLVKGHANKVIARSCGITEATVKVNIKSILRKIRLGNRTQAAVWALENTYPAADLNGPSIKTDLGSNPRGKCCGGSAHDVVPDGHRATPVRHVERRRAVADAASCENQAVVGRQSYDA